MLAIPTPTFKLSICFQRTLICTVISYLAQGEIVDRVIINVNPSEPDVLLNQRMSYVAVSRVRDDAVVYTNSTDQLGEVLDRQVDK